MASILRLSSMVLLTRVLPLLDSISATLDAALQRPVVTLPQGRIVGKKLTGEWPQTLESFRGIPYAVPPTGDRRFRPLETLPNSTITFHALDLGPVCPGKAFRSLPPKPYNEDCLTVNIFRPAGTSKGANLPVAVHVHGGAFNRGFGAMQNMPSMLGWSEEPFVGVNFNYRIGALGFLPSGLTAKEGLLNLGLRDIIFFFIWLRENVEEFGGDPNHIIAFGLSAGAHAIGHLIMDAEREEPLFKRAILESGATTARAVHDPTVPLHEQQFKEFVAAAGCSDAPETSIFPCLREQPANAVINASFTVFDAHNPSLRWAFQPSIDGTLIKRRPTESWKTGRWQKMPILTGYCGNEAASYVPTAIDTPEEFSEYFRTLMPGLTDKDIAELNELYPDPESVPTSPYVDTRPLPLGSQYKRAEAAYAHYAYVCPIRATARFASKGQKDPVYLYHWALNQTVEKGANHGDEMPYAAYELFARSFSPMQEKIAREVHAYWTSFITKGNPNALGGRGAGRPEWVVFKRGKDEAKMIFGEGNDEKAGGSGVGTSAKMVDDSFPREECEWWWSKGLALHQ
ncbi:alpha/beta-hydrolase [Zopfia rhizophila CBS 207.26]|uniref:Alpha/beta-hydrolase n=1 Tax=Zopfia rhizophila CBS 207.26 TaxID=1314779 RepID=A0A6A6EQ83_9PEZI|nr:alpha/beta-hydrolase [Zopfia rhizophila CBS 207.26]